MGVTSFAAIYVGSYEVNLKVFEISGKKNIRIIDHVRSRVELGSLTGDSDVVVLRGIKPGERVVSAGVYHLTDGEVVRIEEN